MVEIDRQHCVIQWDPTSGRANGASRSEIAESFTCCNSCGQASEVGRTSVVGRCKTSERRGYYVRVNYLSLESLAAGSLARVMNNFEELKRVWHYLRGDRLE